MGAAPHQHPWAGWEIGLEALCCLSCSKQETLAAEPAKCFVIHPSPRGIFPGQPLCPSSCWLGAHSEPSTGAKAKPSSSQEPALLTQPCPSSSGGKCSAPVEGRTGCQGFVLGLQPSRQILAFAVQGGRSSVSLWTDVIALTSSGS